MTEGGGNIIEPDGTITVNNSAAAAAFIQFEISEEGQKIVEREGFFPISPAHRAANEKNLH